MENPRYFANTMSDYVPGADVNVNVKHWKHTINITVDSIQSNMPPTVDHTKGGLYVGCAGVAYMFYSMTGSDVFSPTSTSRRDILSKAKQYIDTYKHHKHSHTHSKMPDEPAAFLHGDGGILVVRSLVLEALGNTTKSHELIDRYLSMSSTVQSSDFSADEMFVGRSGYLCGLILLKKVFHERISDVDIEEVAESIITSGRTYSAKHKSPCPLMYAYHGKEYLGAAHGLTGILLMLMKCPKAVKIHKRLLQETVDFLLDVRQTNGNLSSNLEKAISGVQPSESRELVHWCHGASGAVYLFARAFLLWKDAKYLSACQRCGELVWQKGLLRKGPGICHGVAGSGYVFLLLYRLTSDEKHLHRALQFAQFMQTSEFRQARTPDRPYSLFEGLAGTVCFLTDLLQPHRAEFPFFNIF